MTSCKVFALSKFSRELIPFVILDYIAQKSSNHYAPIPMLSQIKMGLPPIKYSTQSNRLIHFLKQI